MTTPDPIELARELWGDAMADRLAAMPVVATSEACDEPPEPDYCQHRARVCECDRAADIYYGDIR